MYNRYIPDSGSRQSEYIHSANVQTDAGEGFFGAGQPLFQQLGSAFRLFGGEAKNAGIAGILKGLGLNDLDSGDILLLLILLLIFLEGDNTELVITLGLMLLLGGEEDQKE